VRRNTYKAFDVDLHCPVTLKVITTPGAFAGTPEFASPEQFAGACVEIPFGPTLAGRGDETGEIRSSVGQSSRRKFELGLR
jgi:hypothetical protein